MLNEHNILLSKVQLIMESPTERNKYMELETFKDKLLFLKDHFIMNDSAIRLLERKYLLSEENQEDLIRKVDDIIAKIN